MAKNLPIVSVVGRPNVGKSSLFNRILRKRIAVVDDTSGVTRDRNYMRTTWNGVDFNLVDTGGMVPTSKEDFAVEINSQVEIAIEESSVIIFLVDATVGPTDIDTMIAKLLRKGNSNRVIVAANKAESKNVLYDLYTFLELGFGDPITISALHGRGIGDLLDNVVGIIKKLGAKKNEKESEAYLSIAIIGRPNAGKSSLVNKLLNDKRMIVTNIPGTTRDAVDSFMEYNGKKIKIIDTAGLRKKSNVHDDIEYYSNLRALSSVDRCDVAILLIDSTMDIGEQDLKIIAQINKMRKGIVLAWNKWDIFEKDHKTFDKMVRDTKLKYMELQFTPMLSVSALTGKRTQKIIESALAVKERMTKRVKPSNLRDSLFTWTKLHPHPFIRSKQVRFLGIKQDKTSYPKFLFYCSYPENIVPSYKRFLINKFQEEFDFSGCPVSFEFRAAAKPGVRKTSSDIEIEKN